jgi:hypothetical protein
MKPNKDNSKGTSLGNRSRINLNQNTKPIQITLSVLNKKLIIFVIAF